MNSDDFTITVGEILGTNDAKAVSAPPSNTFPIQSLLDLAGASLSAETPSQREAAIYLTRAAFEMYVRSLLARNRKSTRPMKGVDDCLLNLRCGALGRQDFEIARRLWLDLQTTVRVDGRLLARVAVFTRTKLPALRR